MTSADVLTIVLAAIVTYGIRVSFLAVAARMAELPRVASVVLRMIPAAALSAITVPGLLRPDGLGFDPLNPVALGGVAAVIVSLWTRNVGLSLVAGLIVVVSVRPLLG